MSRLDLRHYQPRLDLLNGRVVLVTGAGQGIGRAVSLACAQHGATVVLLGKTVSKLEAVYDDILASGGPEPAIYPMDIAGASTAQFEELARNVESQLGRLDGLVNNAAILGGLTPIEQTNPDQWSLVLTTNVTAAFQLTRATLHLLRAAPGGRILFTTAPQGRVGRAFWGAYAVSKFAVEGLAQVLSDELENVSNLRIYSVDPGPVRTPLRASAYPGELPTSVPLPESIVNAYLYLLGPDSKAYEEPRIEVQGDGSVSAASKAR